MQRLEQVTHPTLEFAAGANQLSMKVGTSVCFDCGPIQEDARVSSACGVNGCQRAAESPHFGARNFPHLAGTAISRLGDRRLRVLAIARDA